MFTELSTDLQMGAAGNRVEGEGALISAWAGAAATNANTATKIVLCIENPFGREAGPWSKALSRARVRSDYDRVRKSSLPDPRRRSARFGNRRLTPSCVPQW